MCVAQAVEHPESEPDSESVDRGDELFEDAVDVAKTQVSLLVEMGFPDEVANLDALRRADGIVEAAVEILTWEATEVL